MEKNKPTEIRRGRIKATIWENDTKNGLRYNVTFARIYRVAEEERKKDDSGWRESDSYGRDDLPLLQKVADLVFDWMYTQGQDDQ